MAGACPTNNAIQNAARSANGLGADFTMNGYGYDARDALERALQSANRESILSELTEASPDVVDMSQTTRADTTRARSIAMEMQKLIDIAAPARENRNEMFLDAAPRHVSGTSTYTMGTWENFTNRLYTKFVNSRGAFHKWLHSFAAQPGVVPYMERLIQLDNVLQPQIRELNNRFFSKSTDFVVNLREASLRTGHHALDLADMVGHYATARHAREANDYLLNVVWPRMLEAERAKGDEANSSTINELLFNMQELSENRNNLNPPRYLVSSGYTDAEAALLMRQIEKDSGMTRGELDAAADRLSRMYFELLEERVRAGVVDPTVLREFPPFRYYVPMRSRVDNAKGAPNDAATYNPGVYRPLRGMMTRPDSAFATYNSYASRAATEIGMQEWAAHLYALHNKLLREGVDSGLRANSYDTLSRMRNSRDADQRALASSVLDRHVGLVTDVPVRRKDGTITTERRYLWFDTDSRNPVFSKLGIQGKELEEALTSAPKLSQDMFGTIAQGTSLMGQLYTRFSPLFSPMSGMRDIMERGTHMAGRQYYADDGSALDRTRLLSAYTGNLARAGQILMDGLRGREMPTDSLNAQYWDEYQRFGLMQRRTPGMAQRTADPLSYLPDGLKQKKELMRWLDRTGGVKDAVLNRLDNWNEYFQHIGSMSQYITLREAGVPPSIAASNTLEIINMGQKGTATNSLRVLYPFVVATMQSAAALGRTLGLSARGIKAIPGTGKYGWAALGAAYGAYSLLYPLVRDAMGTDEEGNSRFDAMRIGDVTRFLPIATGGNGEYVKFPIGFGIPNIAAVLAVGSDRVRRGLMTPEDFAFETMFTVVKNTMPGNWPSYSFTQHPAEYVMTMLTPQPFLPILESGMNLNTFGSPVYNEPFDSRTARADSGRTSTPVEYHNAAKWLMRTFGYDVAPEQLRHTFRSVFAGPLRVVTAALENDSLHKGSHNPTALSEMHPLLAGLGMTTWYGKANNTTRTMYYNAKEHYDDRLRRSGIKLTDPSNRGNKEEAAAFRRKRLEDSGEFTPDEIDDILTIWDADKAMRQLSKDFNTEYKQRWLDMETSAELRSAFETLGTNSDSLYADAVNALNYYNGMR